MTNEELLKVILSDIEQAKSAKTDIDNMITGWLAEFNGDPYGNETDGKSKIVLKDIKKSVEWFIPTASDPFVKKPRIVKLEGLTADDVPRAKVHERLLNYQALRKFDFYTFINNMFRVSSTEGTVIIRTGWELKEKEDVQQIQNINEATMQIMAQEGYQFTELIENPDGTVDATAIKRIPIENRPTAEVVKNGNVLPDPTATSVEDANFVVYKYETTASNLRESGQYDEESIEEALACSSDDKSTLETTRDSELDARGQDSKYESEDEANKKIIVYEYWGNLDKNGDGIAEPLFVTLINNKIVEAIDNPFPDKEIPFVEIPFSPVAFGFWGNPLAEFLSDNQKIRTSLMRGFIDNVAQSNNGNKYIKKGAMDAINKKKHEKGTGSLIEVNGDRSDFWEGEFNAINPSVYSLYEIVQQEAESLSGINRTMQGVDSRGLNDSATGASIQQTNSQRRMMDVIRRHANGLKKVFRKWIAYNKEFLSDDEVMRISGEFIEFTRDDISGEFDIDITVGTDGIQEAKVNQMTMLMQQVGGLAGVASIPPNFFNMMLAKMADEWGYPDIAKALENPEPQKPSPIQQKLQELEVEEKVQDIEEKKSKSMLNMSKANAENVESRKSALGVVDGQ